MYFLENIYIYNKEFVYFQAPKTSNILFRQQLSKDVNN